ncbi:MAG: hypothetical protein ACYC1U_11010 [Candidatus Aquicultorales bacterium]
MARKAKWRALALFMAGFLLPVLMQSQASALDPPTPPGGFTFSEQPNVPSGSGYNPDIPHGPGPYGGSIWVYSDMLGTADLEGTYKPFEDQANQLYNSNALVGADGKVRTPGPHGLYDTTSNKCSICHAVHLATGTYSLLRVDAASHACDYCHVGDHRHSRLAAYSNAGTIYPSNGHTIGAGPEIPDSSTWQWSSTRAVTTADGGSHNLSDRSYDPLKNRMFRWELSDLGWERVGPVTLECITCHQPHNATELLWNPSGGYGVPSGYKLLRASPSGSVDNAAFMRNFTPGTSSDPTPIGTPLTVPEGELSAATTGPGKTTYTQWKGPAVALDSTSLSVWCADCHNLNIGYKEAAGPGMREWSHSDRTHPVPFGLRGGGGINGQCYSCHVSDLTGTACGSCHLTPYDYANQTATSDFPHSGQAAGFKLLGDDLSAIGGPNNLVSSADLDKVCLRCHQDVGVGY